MNTLGERVRSLRKEQGITQDELSHKMGYSSKTTITKIENGQRLASTKQLELLAKALHTTKAYLVGGEEEADTQLLCAKFPILGEVAAGFDWYSEVDDNGEYEFVPREWLHRQDPKNFFVCRVHGDSMYPLYLDGDRLLVRRLPSVPSGSVAVLQYDSDFVTVKQLRYEKGQDWLELIPLNREFAPKVITGPDLERCRVCGEVWKVIRDVK